MKTAARRHFRRLRPSVRPLVQALHTADTVAVE